MHINKDQLQGDTSSVCGRYSILFTAMHKMGINPDDMIEFLKKGGKKYGSVDKFVLKLFDEK